MLVAERKLPNGKVLHVNAMTFGKGRLCIGPDNIPSYDDGWWFDSVESAVAEMNRWDPEKEPEPTGWFRNPLSGRRRPGGDPTKEYVEFWKEMCDNTSEDAATRT